MTGRSCMFSGYMGSTLHRKCLVKRSKANSFAARAISRIFPGASNFLRSREGGFSKSMLTLPSSTAKVGSAISSYCVSSKVYRVSPNSVIEKFCVLSNDSSYARISSRRFFKYSLQSCSLGLSTIILWNFMRRDPYERTLSFSELILAYWPLNLNVSTKCCLVSFLSSSLTPV